MFDGLIWSGDFCKYEVHFISLCMSVHEIGMLLLPMYVQDSVIMM